MQDILIQKYNENISNAKRPSLIYAHLVWLWNVFEMVQVLASITAKSPWSYAQCLILSLHAID